MTRLFTEGFEGGDDLFWSFQGNIASPRVTTYAKRSGSYSYAAYTSQGTFLKEIISSTDLYLRFAYTKTLSAFHHKISFLNNAVECFSVSFYLSSPSVRGVSIIVNDVVVASTLMNIPENWVLYEIHGLLNASGEIEVRINGVTACSYSGDTTTAGEVSMNSIQFANSYDIGGAPLSYVYYDDLGLNDSEGVADNTWCGDGHVIAIVPDANGDLSQLTGADGDKVNNYLQMTRPPNSAKYVQGYTVNEKDLYNLSACGITNATIKRVWAESRSRDTTTSGGLIALVLKTGGTEYAGADMSLSTSLQQIIGTVYTLNPKTGLAWTPTDLNALQAGPKTRS